MMDAGEMLAAFERLHLASEGHEPYPLTRVAARVLIEVVHGELLGLDLAYEGRLGELTRRIEQVETLARMAGATSTLP